MGEIYAKPPIKSPSNHQLTPPHLSSWLHTLSMKPSHVYPPSPSMMFHDLPSHDRPLTRAGVNKFSKAEFRTGLNYYQDKNYSKLALGE